jgi:hypothetical protein
MGVCVRVRVCVIVHMRARAGLCGRSNAARCSTHTRREGVGEGVCKGIVCGCMFVCGYVCICKYMCIFVYVCLCSCGGLRECARVRVCAAVQRGAVIQPYHSEGPLEGCY